MLHRTTQLQPYELLSRSTAQMPDAVPTWDFSSVQAMLTPTFLTKTTLTRAAHLEAIARPEVVSQPAALSQPEVVSQPAALSQPDAPRHSFKRQLKGLLAIVAFSAMASLGLGSSTASAQEAPATPVISSDIVTIHPGTGSGKTRLTTAEYQKLSNAPLEIPLGTTGGDAGVNDGNRGMLRQIKERGVLSVGIQSDVKGLSYRDPQSGELSGLEVVLANNIARELEVKPHLVVVTAASRTELLDQGIVDLVLATFTITKERAQHWDFSPAYYNDEIAVLVPSGTATEIKDVLGMRIGVAVKSDTAHSLIKALIAKDLLKVKLPDAATFEPRTWHDGVIFVEYGNNMALAKALASNEIDGFASDHTNLIAYAQDGLTLIGTGIIAQEYGIATPKDTDLSGKINELISKWREDGSLATWRNEQASVADTAPAAVAQDAAAPAAVPAAAAK